MKGDRHKSMSSFARWIEYFGDGIYSKTSKGKNRIPSSGPSAYSKRYERRWRRHQATQGVRQHD